MGFPNAGGGAIPHGLYGRQAWGVARAPPEKLAGVARASSVAYLYFYREISAPRAMPSSSLLASGWRYAWGYDVARNNLQSFFPPRAQIHSVYGGRGGGLPTPSSGSQTP